MLWQVTFIWLSLQNASTAESRRWPSTNFRISTCGGCCKLIFSLVVEHIADDENGRPQSHAIETIRGALSPPVFFLLYIGMRTTFLQKIFPKYQCVYPENREGQIHGYSLCLKSFFSASYCKLGQAVSLNLDHCLKHLVIVLFFASLTFFLFSFPLPNILLNNKKSMEVN